MYERNSVIDNCYAVMNEWALLRMREVTKVYKRARTACLYCMHMGHMTALYVVHTDNGLLLLKLSYLQIRFKKKKCMTVVAVEIYKTFNQCIFFDSSPINIQCKYTLYKSSV